MNTPSAGPAEHSGSEPGRLGQGPGALIWDAPVRAFHWLMVACFAGAYATGDSERWRLVHVTLGYTMAGLVAFRIVGGFVGTRYARFSNFVRGPRAVVTYASSLFRGRPEHFLGHNPAGAVVIVTLLGLTCVVAATGWAALNEVGGEWFEEVHELVANLMLAVVGAHIVGVVASSWLHHENLVGAMFTGRKQASPKDALRSAWRSVAMLMLFAVLAFWMLQWQAAPSGGAPSDSSASARHQDRD